MHRRIFKTVCALLCAAAMIGLVVGCQPASATTTTTTTTTSVDGLYMTDTYSGKVFVYNPSTETASTTSLVSTGQNATGAIYFYKGVGYIAVGSSSNTAPGVYYFNPSDSTPKAVQIGSSVSAQYIAFYSTTKAYVSVANYSGTGGVYTFNPSDPSAGLTGPITSTGASGLYLQQIVVGPDSKIYVASSSTNSGADQVLQINPNTDALTGTTFAATTSGTTALASGSYGGNSGVFVGNITYSNAGSIDFINTSAATPSISQVLGSIDVSRIVVLSADKLVTTGYSKSYIVSGLSGTPSPTELGSSLSGADLAYQNGLIYVGYGDYTNKVSKLYVFDTSGAAESYSPVSVMGSGNVVAGLAFYQD